MKHITPIFLTHALARATTEQRTENMSFGIQLKRTSKKKKAEDNETSKSEVKIMFSPIPVVEIDLSQRPPEEDWSKFDKDGSPYDSTQNIECEVLECFLRHGLPDGALEAPVQPSKAIKRKRKTNDQAPESSPPSKRQRPSNSSIGDADAAGAGAQTPGDAMQSQGEPVPKKRGRPRKDAESGSSAKKTTKKKQRKSKTGNETPAPIETHPPPVFKQPRAMPLFKTSIVDLGADDSDSQSEPPASGSHVSKTTNNIPYPVRNLSSQETTIDKEKIVAGEVISAEALHGLRAASSLLRPPLNQQPGVVPKALPPSARSPRPAAREVIDLT